MIKLYLLTLVIYSTYATLPFFNLNRTAHYLSGAIFAVSGSLIWVSISRSVNKSDISLHGLYFDAIITVAFMLTPLLFTGINFTAKQILGICMIFTGMLVSKL
jgi:hypothetical protein